MSIKTLGAIAFGLLLAAGAAAAQTPGSAPSAPSATPALPPVTNAVPEAPKDDLPRGAPRDDYQFIGWCEGALATHMQL